MKKLLKKGLALVLSLAMVLAFMPALPGGQASAAPAFNSVSMNAEFSVSTSSPVYYQVYVPEYTYIDGMYIDSENWAVIFECISAGGMPKITQVKSDGTAIGASHETWGGHEEEAVKAACGDYVYFKIEGGLGSKFKIKGYPWPGNDTEKTAYRIYDDPGIVDFQGLSSFESRYDYGVQYYYIEATEKAKYRLKSDDFGLKVKNGSGEYKDLEKGKTGTYTVNKGERLYFEVLTKQKMGTVTVQRDIFNRMTSMKLDKTSYSVVQGNALTFKLAFDKLDPNKALESTISKRGAYNASTGNLSYTVTQQDINTYKTEVLDNPGIYDIKIVNSEGLTATAKVTVKPKAPKVSGYTATGTTKSSTVSIYNTLDGITGFAVFLKDSSGKYVQKGFTKKNSKGYNKYTVSGLKPNKTYYVKVKAYKTCGSEKVYSNLSSAMKIITAPAKAPRITSAKATGTKYHKAQKVWQKGYWDAGGVWHKGHYVTRGAYSTAAVRVKYSKVKGATSYKSNGISFAKGIAGYKFSGKIKAGKKQKVKIRTVKTSGRATAYGPWSKVRTVKLKAAK